MPESSYQVPPIPKVNFQLHRSNQPLVDFIRTRESNLNESEYFDLLTSLRPDRLEISKIAEIVGWIESSKKIATKHNPHINIFGTGGDGTINVSSMASLLASRFVRVVKVGTRAVTSLYGSSDFFSTLDEYVKTLDPITASKLRFHNDSEFIRLSEIGFDYSENLKNARRILKKENIPDIYKIVFPFADYTKPDFQINGASSKIYFDIFRKLAVLTKRNCCIIHSEHDIDELTPGNNHVALCIDGKIELIDYEFAPSSPEFTALKELPDIKDSVELWEKVATRSAPPIIQNIIDQNASLIITCFSLAEQPTSSDFIKNLSHCAKVLHEATN